MKTQILFISQLFILEQLYASFFLTSIQLAILKDTD